MSRWYLGVVSLFLLAFQAVNGEGCTCGRCTGFEAAAELLYLRPTTCDLNYAITDPRQYETVFQASPTDDQMPVGKDLAIDPNYHLGFRIKGAYLFECGKFDWTLQVTDLHATEHTHFDAPGSGGFYPTFGNPRYLNQKLFNPRDLENAPNSLNGVTTVRFDQKYDAIDLQYGFRFRPKCRLRGRHYLGLHYAHIEHHRFITYQGTEGPEFNDIFVNARTLVSEIENKYYAWGIGPRWGCHLDYTLGCGFGLSAEVSGGVMAGSRRGRFKERDIRRRADTANTLQTNQLSEIPWPESAIVTPILSGRLGFNASFCTSCYTLLLEGGYEFTSYFNAVRQSTFNHARIFPATSSGALSQQCDSFNLDGLYLMGQLTF